MSIPIQIALIGLAWGVLIYFTARICMRSAAGSVGLPLAYLITMTFLHIGAFTYLMPGYSHLRGGANPYLYRLDYTDQMNLQGTYASLLTVLGIAIGCFVLRGRGSRAVAPTGQAVASSGPQLRVPRNRNPLLFALLGISSLGFLFATVQVQSVQSIIVTCRSLAIVTVCLGFWITLLRKDTIQFSRWVLLGAAIPAIYLIVFGFFSYGFAAMAILFSFWLAMPRPKSQAPLKRVAINAAVVYLSMSAFVSYMSVREKLRWTVLWREDATFFDKIVGTLAAMTQAKFFNPFDPSDLDWFNVRLNQNIFIGKALWWHEMYPALALKGTSILYATIAWVPRVLWPGKPEMGGSAFVAEHTGMVFSRQVAIASGPTFEFVVNFGMIGSLGGGIALGLILRMLDRSCAGALRREDYARFIRSFLIGVAVVAPTAQLFFIVPAAAAAWLVGTGMMFWMKTNAPNRPVTHALSRR